VNKETVAGWAVTKCVSVAMMLVNGKQGWVRKETVRAPLLNNCNSDCNQLKIKLSCYFGILSEVTEECHENPWPRYRMFELYLNPGDFEYGAVI
jgi:hypothetical protein